MYTWEPKKSRKNWNRGKYIRNTIKGVYDVLGIMLFDIDMISAIGHPKKRLFYHQFAIE